MHTVVIEIDQDIKPTLYAWHGGQWDPVYAVASSIGTKNEKLLTKNTVGSALNNLERDYRKAKGVTRQDKRDLKYAIRVLSLWYDSMPDDGSED